MAERPGRRRVLTASKPSKPSSPWSELLMSNYGVPPVEFVKGSGSRLWDADGKEYLDFLGGLAVTSLGHAHPAVAEAVSLQARTLVHVSNLFGTQPVLDVAATLDTLIGDGSPAGGRLFFANSGAEANEAAIKLARRHAGGIVPTGDGGWAGRYKIVAAHDGFHGRTMAALAATGQPAKQEPFLPLPDGFLHVAWNDLDALDAAIDDSVAALLLEPIQGEAGVNPASRDYFRGARRLTEERGALFMVDEVQTGLGRTGRWFGFQHHDVEPDVVTMAKALGNGVPIGACWARADVADSFRPGDHGSTFGGQPLAAAAARAVLEVMQAEDVPGRALRAGAALTARLEALPQVVAVRGSGLLLGAELRGLDAREVAAACLAAGLVVNGVTGTALRLAPSLLVSDDEIDQAVGILAVVLAAAGSGDGEER
ncbi:MAG TPA: acetylornithine transaminase [Acidimicrobiales bacterium]|jgi:predicted acetylornithine/succinylornithine family transaminase|nr:acetylornithine transaminase [Acidimicrobiales bacterium]